MPIRNFNGNTFVAFLDISGFKKLMKDEKRAGKALDRLYQCGYDVLRENDEQVEGLFVSDCGILFVRNSENKMACLENLLRVIKEINREMLRHRFMLTTSIAHGHFKYQERIELTGMDKNLMYGNAYLSAFLDNESGRPKIQPGQCRVIKENLPDEVKSVIDRSNHPDETFKLVKGRKGDRKHYYFYWMVDGPSEINNFENEYSNAYNLKYYGMLKALRGDNDYGHQSY